MVNEDWETKEEPELELSGLEKILLQMAFDFGNLFLAFAKAGVALFRFICFHDAFGLGNDCVKQKDEVPHAILARRSIHSFFRIRFTLDGL